MKYVKLGKTGLEVSEVGFGRIPIIRLSAAGCGDGSQTGF